MTEIAIQHVDGGAQRMGFFTDTTVCIGCKACEVACKQWNDLPADGSRFTKGGSYDHTGELSASELHDLFRATYLAVRDPYELVSYKHEADESGDHHGLPPHRL